MLKVADVLKVINSIEQINLNLTPHFWGMVSSSYVKTSIELREEPKIVVHYKKDKLELKFDDEGLPLVSKVHSDDREEYQSLSPNIFKLTSELPNLLSELRSYLRSVPASFGELYDTEFSLDIFPDKSPCIWANIRKENYYKYLGLVQIPIQVDDIPPFMTSFDDAYAHIRIKHLKDLIIKKYVKMLTKECELRLASNATLHEYLICKSNLDALKTLLECQIITELSYISYKEESRDYE